MLPRKNQRPRFIQITQLSLLALGLSAANSAQALDLLQTWERTRAHDPQMAVVQATLSSSEALRTQAAALWRPQIQASAGAGLSTSSSDITGAQFAAPGFGQSNGASFSTSIHQGTATRLSFSAKQALYNPERDAQQAQLKKQAEVVVLQADLAQQNLMLETVQRYFDLVLAERKLAVMQKQYQAITRAWTEAKDRFALGDTPITDTHEAAARARGVQAQVLATDSELQMARLVLAQATGLSPEGLKVMSPRAGEMIEHVPDAASLQAQAQDNNLGLRLQKARVAMAEQETRKHHLSASATLDAVAIASRDRLSGNGDFGSASNIQNQQMIGLSFSMPLYTGGWREGKLQESLSAQGQAEAELALQRLQVSQRTQMRWLALQNGQAQVSAWSEGLTASRARLEATRLGRQVGDRTTQELLNAENDAANAELTLLSAQLQLLLSRLQLDALTGELSIDSLQSVNAKLVN
jgi:outer membrane protein